MKICICDDDKVIHNEIEKILTDNSFEYDITHCYSGYDIQNRYNNGYYADIVFMDVELGDASGLKIAEEIKCKQSNAIIIFISSHPNYVFESFKCEAFHFIVKPIDINEFLAVIERALHKYQTIHKNYNISWRGTRFSIPVSEIIYIEGYKRHLKIYTSTEDFEHVGKISEAIEFLYPYGFVQVHQGYIVNMKNIKQFGNDFILLDNGLKIMMSGRKRPHALKTYDSYIQKWKW